MPGTAIDAPIGMSLVPVGRCPESAERRFPGNSRMASRRAVTAGSGRAGRRSRREKPIDATIGPLFGDGKHVAAEKVVDPLRGGIHWPVVGVCAARLERRDAVIRGAIRTACPVRNLRNVAKLPLRLTPPGPAAGGEAVVPSRCEFRIGTTTCRARSQSGEGAARLMEFPLESLQ